MKYYILGSLFFQEYRTVLLETCGDLDWGPTKIYDKYTITLYKWYTIDIYICIYKQESDV